MSHTPRRASSFLPQPSKEPLQKRRPSSPILATSIPQLSIADRFMSTSFHTKDPPSRKPSLGISNSDIHARQSQKDPERLTIAGAFTKLSDDSHSSENGPVHPLDTIPKAPARHDSQLDLNIPPIPPRPFGSQDTLVNQNAIKGGEEEKYDKVSLTDPSDFSSTTRHGNDDEKYDMGFQPQPQQIKMPEGEKRRRCGGRRWRVFTLFLSTLGLIILSAIFWPRTPLIRIEGASLVSPAKITETNQGTYMLGNVQFETQWMVNYTVDNRQNWLLPTRLVQLHVLVKDVLTGNVIGKGVQNDPIVLDPGVISTITLPVSLDYQAREGSDTTFASLKKACVRMGELAGMDHESLSLSFWMTLHIWGLDFFGYRPTVIVAPATGGFVCPLG